MRTDSKRWWSNVKFARNEKEITLLTNRRTLAIQANLVCYQRSFRTAAATCRRINTCNNFEQNILQHRKRIVDFKNTFNCALPPSLRLDASPPAARRILRNVVSPRLASGWSENGLTSKKMQNADDDLSELIGKRKTNREHSQHGWNMNARFNTNKNWSVSFFSRWRKGRDR